MAKAESDDEQEVAVQEVEEEITDLNGAIRRVLKEALAVDGVCRGLHEVAKNIDAEKAKVCFLASNCNEPAYQKLVKGLCLERNIPLVDVEEQMVLGEWAGLCKIDADGNPKKVVKASSVCIVEYGNEHSRAYDFLQNYLSKAS